MIDKKNKKIISLATGKKNVAKKNESDISSKITPEEDRKIKAKKTVEKLLEGVNLIPTDKNDDVFELDTNAKKSEGIEWLQEQVASLSIENETLRNELAEAKENYSKILNQLQRIKNNDQNELLNETIKQNVLHLFDELQNNYLGHNQQRIRYHDAKIDILLNKLLLMFPFTVDIKKF